MTLTMLPMISSIGRKPNLSHIANMSLPTGGVVISEKIQLTIEVEATLKKD